MSEEQQQAPADIEQYEEVYADIPQWPKVVGIISIVLASLGGCCLVVQIVQLALKSAGITSQQRSFPEELQNQIDALTQGPFGMIALALGALGTVTLMTAGITTVGRKSIGRVLHLVYACISLISVALGIYMMMRANDLIVDYIQQNPSSDLAKARGFVLGIMKVIMAVQCLIGGAYPLFTLIWFGLVKRTHESMTGIPDAASTEDQNAT